MKLPEKIKGWAKKLKEDLVVLHLVSKDPRTPVLAKLLIFLIIAYALSPIDLIPDFIPIIGFLDDIILLPLGILAVIKLIPKEILAEARLQAKTYKWDKKKNWWIGGIILVFWIFIISWFAFKKFHWNPFSANK